MNKIGSNHIIKLTSCQNILGNNANDHIADCFRKCNMEIDSPKKDQKSNFISSDSVLRLVYYLEILFLHRNARNICVAICGGFAKNIANFTGLLCEHNFNIMV